jgi:hypothetical protein
MVAAGATTVAVDEIGWYSASGGTVRAGTVIFTYTGRDADSGPGNSRAAAASRTRSRRANRSTSWCTVDDATAQTRWPASSAAVRAASPCSTTPTTASASRIGCAREYGPDDTYKVAQQKIAYVTVNPYTRPGRAVAVSIAAPVAISTSLTVQEQKLRGRSFARTTSRAGARSRSSRSRRA